MGRWLVLGFLLLSALFSACTTTVELPWNATGTPTSTDRSTPTPTSTAITVAGPVNTCWPLLSSEPGLRRVALAKTGTAPPPDSLLVLWQVQANDDGSQGMYQLAWVEEAADQDPLWAVQLSNDDPRSTGPLVFRTSYRTLPDTHTAQACTFPVWRDVDVSADIEAVPFDGTGGIVAFEAKGKVSLIANAGINATARGFAGGPATVPTPLPVGTCTGTAPAVETNDDRLAAGKGRGWAIPTAPFGVGPAGNGGGGGGCNNSGGGGGGSGGAGGPGGNRWMADGGLTGGGAGGAATGFPLSDRLFLGGGGGAGHDGGLFAVDSVPDRSGTRGGGVVWVRTTAMDGAGSVGITANGEPGKSVPQTFSFGLGGSGAGGSIRIEIVPGGVGSAIPPPVEAKGGDGSLVEDNGTLPCSGPAGGGGGGRVSTPGWLGVVVTGGLAGTCANDIAPVNTSYGAGPGLGGVHETESISSPLSSREP